ncbi:LacI family DNA-binding transcriptional regulator [Tessaracoccus terricola]
MRAVAEKAGVSPATASAVLNAKTDGTIRVGEPTRKRVLAAARELGYSPNRAARSLRTRQSHLIGVVVPDITNPLFPRFVRAAQLRAEELGYYAMVWDTFGDADRERAAVRAMLTHGVDAVVLVTDHLTGEDLAPLLRAGVALAATDADLDADAVDRVSEDLAEGARRATMHLVERGHKHIAHIAGDLSNASGRRRRDGYAAVMAAHGLSATIVGGDSFDPESGRAAMAELLDLDDRPTAVYAANDMIAIGALRAVHAAGLRVPEDVAIVGTDDISHADVVHPALTTMDVRPEQVARRLVEVTVARLTGDVTAPVREIVTPVLVPRSSS